MNRCYNTGDFKKYFDENMKALGAPVPTTLFDSFEKAIGTASILVGTLHTLGKGATMAELVGATVGVEKLMVAGAFGAAAYVGMIIGSIASAIINPFYVFISIPIFKMVIGIGEFWVIVI